MSKQTTKEMTTVSLETSAWLKSRAKKVGVSKSSLIAIAIHDYRVKKESENNE